MQDSPGPWMLLEHRPYAGITPPTRYQNTHLALPSQAVLLGVPDPDPGGRPRNSTREGRENRPADLPRTPGRVCQRGLLAALVVGGLLGLVGLLATLAAELRVHGVAGLVDARVAGLLAGPTADLVLDLVQTHGSSFVGSHG